MFTNGRTQYWKDCHSPQVHSPQVHVGHLRGHEWRGHGTERGEGLTDGLAGGSRTRASAVRVRWPRWPWPRPALGGNGHLRKWDVDFLFREQNSVAELFSEQRELAVSCASWSRDQSRVELRAP